MGVTVSCCKSNENVLTSRASEISETSNEGIPAWVNRSSQRSLPSLI